MTITASTADEYVSLLPEDRKGIIEELRAAIKAQLPEGFVENTQYGMISYVVPHSIYPAGYHCKPSDALPFMSIASQKNHIAVYHMAVYEGALADWFVGEWPKHTDMKLDMGKSCVRMKNISKIPVKLFGELASKMTPQQWITIYEKAYKSGVK